MNRCKWPSERAATEHIVKFAAVSLRPRRAQDLLPRRHLRRDQRPDAGGVLFEYGGAPRKMYAGVAALTRLLGVPDECVKTVHDSELWAYVFRTKDRVVAIAWCESGHSRKFDLAPTVQAYDIMGNAISPASLMLGQSPIYLAGPQVGAVLASLSE